MKSENYRFKVGTLECIVVSHGTFAYPHPAQIFFANAPKERLEQALRKHNIVLEQWEQYVSPYPSLVINTDEHQVLVDTGAGGFVPTTGNLIPNLQAEGIAPEDIDTVILTHGHPEHIGGSVDEEGKPAFPTARYVMWKEEWEFWTKEPDLSPLKVDEHLKQVILEFARNSHRRFKVNWTSLTVKGKLYRASVPSPHRGTRLAISQWPFPQEANSCCAFPT